MGERTELCFLGYLHSELGIRRLHANFQKLQLVRFALAVSMAASVMGQPVGVVWRRAEDGQLQPVAISSMRSFERRFGSDSGPSQSEGITSIFVENVGLRIRR